jgi:glucose/arabinose dehydrogenase
MYISYTNTDGDTRVESASPDGSNRTVIFATDQPYANHNGGNIIFGPDGMLWLGLGDGGASGDPEDRAQNPDDLHGKLLRFDPADPKPQIWAHGLRNPWRFSFDRETDDLWVGDVGQDHWEEVDHVPAGTPAGSNFGWPQAEGTHGFKDLHPADGSIIPVYEYSHDEGQSIAGGFVYRGSKIPGLVGTYLFADTYTGRLWSLVPGDGDAYTFRDTGVDVPGGLVSSFGEDADGELYVLSLDGGVYRIEAG